MSRKFGYAILVLFVLAAVPGWIGLFAVVHETNTNLAAQRHDAQAAAAAQRREQAAQQRQAQHVQQLLCADLGTMAGIRPPAGRAATNPSRAYEQAEHRAWSGLVVVVGCNGGTP